MDWISGLQRAIDYVEENITEEINFEEVAKRAYSSSFHFQRIFSAICGITLGDYIRFRRLALAGSELSATNAKIIDIALKYGYDSPESFSRAFTKFHGATPSQVKNGACLKSFSRLSVKLIMQGGIMMDYRVEKLDKIKIVCKRERFKAEKELTFEKIPLFWKKCGEDGSIKKLCDMIPKDTKLGGLLGISFSSEFENDSFPYGIGAEYKDGASTEGFEVVEIPAYTYVVFPVRGKMPDAFQETYKKILTEFFPQSSEFKYCNGVELEVYPSDDTENPDYYCEIWIAVENKE